MDEQVQPKGMSVSGMIRTNFWYPQVMIDRLKAAKAKTGTPASELIRRFVDKGLREMGI